MEINIGAPARYQKVRNTDQHSNASTIVPMSIIVPMESYQSLTTFVWVEVAAGNGKTSSPMRNHVWHMTSNTSALSKGYSATVNKSVSLMKSIPMMQKMAVENAEINCAVKPLPCI
jgi:hypothetical protein